MTKARLDGLYLVLLGSLVFILLGVVMENAASSPLADFRGLYYPTQCLLQHCDPYSQTDVMRIYRAEGGDHPSDTDKVRQIATQSVYLPTVFSETLPFAILPWSIAHILWIVLTIASLILASLLAWSLAADFTPVLSGALIGFLLANSEVLLITGNAAGVVVSLCVIAVWCFVRNRFAFAGVLCLAISLAVKPHDTGLVWLYFLFAGGVYMKRALQTLLATIVISLPGLVWAWRLSPHMMQEFNSNLLAFSVHGGTNDPGLASGGAHGLGTVVSLQAIFSVFRDDPQFYNPASYLVFGLLLLVWIFVTLRSRSTPANLWLALASITALSMLPVYHRQYDTKLLLLTVPACAMLFVERRSVGWLALIITTAGFVINADIPWVIFLALIKAFHAPTTGFAGEILIGVQVFSAPLILLVMGIFYLWVYARRFATHAAPPSIESDRSA
ncbi:MAG: glycosyltransferase family 87 protein [Terracidiphilus sp.]